ncbi:MAG: hypothetical protein N2C14_14380, partial [Planctomycetales bacterium]
EEQTEDSTDVPLGRPSVSEADADSHAGDPPPDRTPDEPTPGDALIQLVARFRPKLQLADLKAQLIVNRLSALGEIKSTQPDLDQITDVDQLGEFSVRMETHEAEDRLRAAADVEGVQSIEIMGGASEAADAIPTEKGAGQEATTQEPSAPRIELASSQPLASAATETSSTAPEPKVAADQSRPLASPSKSSPSAVETAGGTEGADPSSRSKSPTRVAETMRVDIERLDNLLNLAGELVVNRARFVQISTQLHSGHAGMPNRIRDVGDSLRRAIESLESEAGEGDAGSPQLQQLREGLELMDEQSKIWDNTRQCFSQIGDAIDQLTRVSKNLQREVLDT